MFENIQRPPVLFPAYQTGIEENIKVLCCMPLNTSAKLTFVCCFISGISRTGLFQTRSLMRILRFCPVALAAANAGAMLAREDRVKGILKLQC